MKSTKILPINDKLITPTNIKDTHDTTHVSSYRSNGPIINEIDTLISIKDTIRNIRILNTIQLDFIKFEMSNNDKTEIIELYNYCFSSLIELLNEAL